MYEVVEPRIYCAGQVLIQRAPSNKPGTRTYAPLRNTGNSYSGRSIELKLGVYSFDVVIILAHFCLRGRILIRTAYSRMNTSNGAPCRNPLV